MRTIVVATANEGKLQAVQSSFEKYGEKYGWTEYEIRSHESASGIASTPMSDEEGLTGCENRLMEAKSSLPGADMYIALEGILTVVKGRLYIRGWTMIEDVAAGKIVSASGSSVEVPAFISGSVREDEEFNDLVAEMYPMDERTRGGLRNLGANGAFTQGEYGRQDSFYDGVRICLSLLDNSKNW